MNSTDIPTQPRTSQAKEEVEEKVLPADVEEGVVEAETPQDTSNTHSQPSTGTLHKSSRKTRAEQDVIRKRILKARCQKKLSMKN